MIPTVRPSFLSPARLPLFLALLILPLLAPAPALGDPAALRGQEAEPLTIGTDLQVFPMGDGIWRHLSVKDQGGEWGRIPANGLLVVSGKEAALIDTPWTEEQTRQLFRWVAEELGAKVTVVVPTHSHEDCLGGLAAAHELSADSYGHEKTAAIARENGATPPRHTFAESKVLQLGERAIELRHLGAGHTVDNIVAWVPDANVLFGGCLIKSAATKGMGYVGEADLAAWPATLDRVAERFPGARIVPGHGGPGGADTLERTRELIAAYVAEHPEATRADPLLGRPFFTALVVRDVDAGVEWYTEVLGLELRRSEDLPERGIRIRLLEGDTSLIELIEDPGAVAAHEELSLSSRMKAHGFVKSGLLVDDLDDAVRRLEALGVPLRGRIFTERDGSLRSVQVEDPDGNIWQLFERLVAAP